MPGIGRQVWLVEKCVGDGQGGLVLAGGGGQVPGRPGEVAEAFVADRQVALPFGVGGVGGGQPLPGKAAPFASDDDGQRAAIVNVPVGTAADGKDSERPMKATMVAFRYMRSRSLITEGRT